MASSNVSTSDNLRVTIPWVPEGFLLFCICVSATVSGEAAIRNERKKKTGYCASKESTAEGAQFV